MKLTKEDNWGLIKATGNNMLRHYMVTSPIYGKNLGLQYTKVANRLLLIATAMEDGEQQVFQASHDSGRRMLRGYLKK